jgi:hypothetical protein
MASGFVAVLIVALPYTAYNYFINQPTPTPTEAAAPLPRIADYVSLHVHHCEQRSSRYTYIVGTATNTGSEVISYLSIEGQTENAAGVPQRTGTTLLRAMQPGESRTFEIAIEDSRSESCRAQVSENSLW